jgi:hypothetical protein
VCHTDDGKFVHQVESLAKFGKLQAFSNNTSLLRAVLSFSSNSQVSIRGCSIIGDFGILVSSLFTEYNLPDDLRKLASPLVSGPFSLSSVVTFLVAIYRGAMVSYRVQLAVQ